MSATSPSSFPWRNARERCDRPREASPGLADLAGDGVAATGGQRRDQRILVGKGLFMRKQQRSVGDRDHIIVERTGGDRLFGLLGEQRSRRIEPT